MDTPRVKISHKYGEMYPNVHGDLAWAGQHREELLAQYGVCVALVYEQQIVGTGQSIDEAVADAEQRLVPDIKHITPAVFMIGSRSRLHYVQRVAKD